MQHLCYRIADLNVKISVHDLLAATRDLLFGLEVDLQADPIPDLTSLRRLVDVGEFLDDLKERYPQVDVEDQVTHVAVG